MKKDKMEYAIAKHFSYISNMIFTDLKLNLRNVDITDMVIIDRRNRLIEIQITHDIDAILNHFKQNFKLYDEKVKKTYFAINKHYYTYNSDKILEIIPKEFGIILVGDTFANNNNKFWNKINILREATLNPNSRYLTLQEIVDICKEGSTLRWKLQKNIIDSKT